MKLLKAVGLNTVSTYIPWNAHEPVKGRFNFSGMLDLEAFISIANDLDLKVMIRTGPYICTEWEWGGLPAWLLHDDNMQVRTNYQAYQASVKDWITKLAGILRPYQYVNHGPIIAFQVENEYGSYPDKDSKHLPFIRDLFLQHACPKVGFSYQNRMKVRF